jgi:hypothetical protein
MNAGYRFPLIAASWLIAAAAPRLWAFDVVLSSQGEYLDAYLVDGASIVRKAFVAPDDPTHGGRHINGKVCFFPDGVGHDGQLVASDDTYDEVCGATDTPDPNATGYKPRCDPSQSIYVGNDPAGWVVLNKDGSWAGRVIHTPGCGPGGQGAACDLGTGSPGTVDPQGCFFDAGGNLWGTDVGHDGDPTDHDGVLVVFFAADDYQDYCIAADTLLSPAMPAYTATTLGLPLESIYLPLSGGGNVLRLLNLGLPVLGFPKSRADCPGADHKLATPILSLPFTLPILSGSLTPAAIVPKRGSDNFYIASVLAPPAILEYNPLGLLVGSALPLTAMPKNPEGVDVGSDGTIYYSELNLQTDVFTQRFFSTGCGSVSKYKPGDPATVTLADHLRFPDGITVVDSSKLDLTKLTDPSDATFCTTE